MKRFFYACLAILCLTLAYHFGATSAQGQSPGSLRRVGGVAGEPYVATDSQIWAFNNGWKTLSQAGQPDPPVPASQVLEYDGNLTITTNGEAYQWVQTAWVSRGVIPDGTINVQPETWSGVKSKFK